MERPLIKSPTFALLSSSLFLFLLLSSSFFLSLFLFLPLQAPERNSWNGDLKGYYIGYKVRSSEDQFLYKTLEVAASSPATDGSVTLTGLRPHTDYVVLVQAYNAMGTGPRSDEVALTTDEDTPSLGPSLVRCQSTGSEGLALTWEQPPTDTINGLLLGFKVIYRPLGGKLDKKCLLIKAIEYRYIGSHQSSECWVSLQIVIA